MSSMLLVSQHFSNAAAGVLVIQVLGVAFVAVYFLSAVRLVRLFLIVILAASNVVEASILLRCNRIRC